MKTVLLTGVAGFIANEVARQWLDQGVRIVGVDNVNDYYDVSIKHHRLDRLRDEENFEFHELDIEDYPALEKLFQEHEFSAVVNLAARAGVRYSMENPHVYFTTNAIGNLNLLQLCQLHGIRKYVLASTSSLYAGQPMPFVETLPVNTPISPYAASKKAAEVTAYAFHNLYDLDISVVRYFTVYGPAGRPDMCIFRFIKWIDQGEPIELFGDGSQSRDFTFVTDIAAGTIGATETELGYEVINLGGGKAPSTINEVIHMIERMLGKKAKIDYKPFHKADIKETRADISKAARLLDWTPQVSLEEGIQQSVQWYLDNHDWVSKVKL